jgi:hypothetical protein
VSEPVVSQSHANLLEMASLYRRRRRPYIRSRCTASFLRKPRVTSHGTDSSHVNRLQSSESRHRTLVAHIPTFKMVEQVQDTLPNAFITCPIVRFTAGVGNLFISRAALTVHIFVEGRKKKIISWTVSESVSL